MDLKEKLKNLRLQIRALALKTDLSDEQAVELDSLMKQAEVVERQIRALDLTADPEPEPEGEGEDDLAALRADVAALRAVVNAPPNNGGIAKLPKPNIKKVSQGFSDDAKGDFLYWMRTGDYSALDRSQITDAPDAVRSNVNPLNSVDDAQGAVLVPDDFDPQIAAKRDEISILRPIGVKVQPTVLDKVVHPIEDASQTYFAITAQESDTDEDEPTFDDVTNDIYDFTKLVIAHLNVLNDTPTRLENFLTESAGRAKGLTENKYLVTGEGTTVPQGVMIGGTAGLTLDAAAAIGAAEIPELLGKLGSGYLTGAAWIMRHATYRYITGLGTSTFRWYAPTPSGVPQAGVTPIGYLEDYPVYVTDEVAAVGAGAKSLLIGNFDYHAWDERQQMSVIRFNELYMRKLQVGFLFWWRAGGGVLQAEAFQYATHPTA